MQKAKEYDWQDSNMALFGSDTDKKVKKESAETEPAWQGAGQEVGLQIWRIVKFKVEHWDKEQYGEFFNGDSYIILNTYKEEDQDALKYDVHFWIGKKSTQDEYGTAAYKTVELDTFLDDKPVQHREVQGHESELFKSYFDSIQIMKGGADTGFRRVLPEAYQARMFHVRKEGKITTVKEVGLKKANLRQDDVFIIDTAETVYLWKGKTASPIEKFAGADKVDLIEGQRKGNCKTVVVENGLMSHTCVEMLSDDPKKEKKEKKGGVRALLKVSDEEGSCECEELDAANITIDRFTSDAVYLFCTGTHLFCWVGLEASIDERRNGLPYAMNYLCNPECPNPPYLPLSVVGQGQETALFNAALDQ